MDIDSIKKYLLPGKTVAFIGSSGVGKSILINTIMGEDVLKTSGIRVDDDKGRHTTTHRELIELENGAVVIDTPGMRELGLWNNSESVESVFADIEELIKNCKFSDCTYKNEPGCKICEAISNGVLSLDRWNSYQKLDTENEYNSNHEKYLLEKRKKLKAIAKELKKR